MHPSPELVGMIAAIREARFIHGLTCLHCDARCVQRWGSFSGRQRYRCGSCARTFSDLTGSAAAYLKKVELLADYARRMPEARSVRYEGRRMKIDKDTALRWRHRLLNGIPEHGELLTVGVSGIVEVADSPFDCVRRPRARSRESWRPPPMRFIVMRDRRRLTYQERCPQERMSSHDFEAATVMLNSGATVVTTTGHLGPVATAIRRRRIDGRELFFRRGYRGPLRITTLYHTRNVLEFIRREKRWLKRFRGVSGRRAHLYLSWFEMVDPTTRSATFEELLMWPVLMELGVRRPEHQQFSGTESGRRGDLPQTGPAVSRRPPSARVD